MMLALVSCAPKAPSSAVDSTPTPVTTPDSTPVIPPSERVPRITIDELLQKIESQADILIVDSRLDVEEQFDAGHIKGAIPVPLSKIMEGNGCRRLIRRLFSIAPDRMRRPVPGRHSN
jgi:3-mercaptopyruvate sulfurtransferase SseA